MAEWIPTFTLPNINVAEPIEAPGIALVSLRDDRIKELAKNHNHFSLYVRRFTTEFGNPVSPSFLILEPNAPFALRSTGALAAFRDAVAMSTIPSSWAQIHRHGFSMGIRYSNWFSFYPWNVDNQYDMLVMNSMAQLAMHDVNLLRAQSAPGITPVTIQQNMIDKPLLTAILDRWRPRFEPETPSKADVALFRSLNMAGSAAGIPGNVEPTIFDVGRSVALWVSAFEILAHEGASGFVQVYKLLENQKWNLTKCNEAIYEPLGHKQNQPLRPLPVWIYGELSRVRNDFMHGNAVTEDTLIKAPGKRSLWLYAAPLYRMALSSFLGMKPPTLVHETTEGYSECLSKYMDYTYPQREIEAALATILEEYKRPDGQ